MSKAYICDVSGVECTQSDIAENPLGETSVMYQGTQFDIELLVRINVTGRSVEDTNIHPNEWPAIMQWVKNKITQVYG
jgi:hypothetical protein